MTTKELLHIAFVGQISMNVVLLGVMAARRAHRVFPQLTWLLALNAVATTIGCVLLFHRRSLGLDVAQAYSVYFYSSWLLNGFILAMRVLVVYGVFAEAMRPLAGLHTIGKIIFRWVAVVSLLVTLALVAGPGVFSSGDALIAVLERLQQGVSVLTLCLLVFVCFAVRPLGLTFRSHLFGVSLGLGISASVELVQAAWSMSAGGRSLYSPVYLFSSVGFCVSLAVWGVYFGLPEPKRRMILLPTTSPFFFWNRISEILGDSPGQVAIAGFTPEMLAPAEIEMLTAATADEAPSQGAEPSEPAERSGGRLVEKPRLPVLGGVRRPSLAA